jgi:hypothetical protein
LGEEEVISPRGGRTGSSNGGPPFFHPARARRRLLGSPSSGALWGVTAAAWAHSPKSA